MNSDASKSFKVALLTNIISPHQLPLAQALVAALGEGNYTYIYTEAPHAERTKMGWADQAGVTWCRQGTDQTPELLEADLLLSGNRALGLFEQRLAANKLTCYMAERWFKPPLGMGRLLVPSYLKMARRFVKLFKSPKFFCLPMGIHSARDLLRMAGLLTGHLGCLFGAPKVAFESRPGGAVVPLKAAWDLLDEGAKAFAKRYGFAQIPQEHWGKVTPTGICAHIRLWGYFVAPGAGEGGHTLPIQHAAHVLWVGRMLNWKRVEDLVRACRAHPNLKRVEVDVISLDLYGHGPEEAALRELAKDCEAIQFHDFVPVAKVREIMRAHDTYVLPSNAYEGWGAVVSEALEEGLQVFAALDSGAGGTMLPPSHLFKAQDVERLRELLRADLPKVSIGPWTAAHAAETLISFGHQEASR